jgi:hypothetical protein
VPPKVLKVLIGLAVAGIAVWAWFGQTRWSGHVSDAAGKPVEGVTVLMINGMKVAGITATEADGSFSFAVGVRPDPALRIMFCKVMYEPSPLFARTAASAAPTLKGGKYTIELAKPDYKDPGVEKIESILPPECQQ